MSFADVKVGLPTVVIVAAIVGAGAFAAGQAYRSTPEAVARAAEPVANQAADPQPNEDMGGGMTGDLPPGHPPIGDMGGAAGMGAAGMTAPPAAESNLTWTAPARWQKVPNPSPMRLATYRIPHAPGDTSDPELSVTQAGGGVDANVQRWIDQFQGEKKSMVTKRTVKGLNVTVVSVEGTFGGGMSGGAEQNWQLLGAIVETPGMPHFFKMTGPQKSVTAARAELDTLLDSLATK